MKVSIVLNSPNKVKDVLEENVIYTDGGYKNRRYLKKKKTLAVVGDFDTLGYIPKKEKIISLEREKNYTDGEKAVLYAKEIGATDISIYGATGGRIEHIFGNIALLYLAKNIGLNAKIVEKDCEIVLCEGKHCFKEKIKTTVSIIPYLDDCVVSESRGLYYSLKDLQLTKGDTRGISNITTEESFSINVVKGLVLVIINKKVRK